ncbi:hypothetical protein BEN71_06165 [Acinetobacter wuhouensis]|uniref:Uncharacterized protein n=1 Tax=Acinetobacter wuhouensis TaxID=1879050 RepID=A0A385C2C5_9GAMM|nr:MULTISPECIES: hypothetical protein [Acinetobacter]AXQ21674.1 hypothetical protein BEN71_06165 [Acinetobacter wuhouensis]AYO53732.1 hypothetical protein CDG68_08875 [Acinetobacter wuhouensis]RZG44825.1 hypothetical protein EXU28_13620 [Acinetobacter wuhouensis]RZG72549.1 hypothetical protein EXU29_10020 [Acinetobacter wuhouensis]RZG76263.1 hypothetical protein EXE09_08415 [Acinetobacter sp. WCHAc060025]
MFIHALEAKKMAANSNLDIELYKTRLAQLIIENANQGNTAVFTVLPKHLALEDIRALSAELTQLGYHIKFEVDEFFYTFNVFWN